MIVSFIPALVAIESSFFFIFSLEIPTFSYFDFYCLTLRRKARRCTPVRWRHLLENALRNYERTPWNREFRSLFISIRTVAGDRSPSAIPHWRAQFFFSQQQFDNIHLRYRSSLRLPKPIKTEGNKPNIKKLTQLSLLTRSNHLKSSLEVYILKSATNVFIFSELKFDLPDFQFLDRKFTCKNNHLNS